MFVDISYRACAHSLESSPSFATLVGMEIQPVQKVIYLGLDLDSEITGKNYTLEHKTTDSLDIHIRNQAHFDV